jgi:hypothetical protein
MAVRLSALRTGRALFPETLFLCFWYSFLLEAEQTPGPCAAGRIRQIKKCIHLISSGIRDWIGLAQVRNKWRDLVNAVMHLRVP